MKPGIHLQKKRKVLVTKEGSGVICSVVNLIRASVIKKQPTQRSSLRREKETSASR